MKIREARGFTLYEIIIVLVIVAILASMALPNFVKFKEHSLGREARQHLKLIVEAEKAFHLHKDAYYPGDGATNNISAINSNLGLTLTNTNWEYSISADPDAFSATAHRAGGTKDYQNCSYTITYNFSSRNNLEEPAPINTTACP